METIVNLISSTVNFSNSIGGILQAPQALLTQLQALIPQLKVRCSKNSNDF